MAKKASGFSFAFRIVSGRGALRFGFVRILGMKGLSAELSTLPFNVSSPNLPLTELWVLAWVLKLYFFFNSLNRSILSRTISVLFTRDSVTVETSSVIAASPALGLSSMLGSMNLASFTSCSWIRLASREHFLVVASPGFWVVGRIVLERTS